MATGNVSGTSMTRVVAVSHKLSHLLPADVPIGLVLGPLVGLLIWWLPLEIEPAAHKAFAIVGFMLVYWITEALDHGMTALIGCFLFWVLQVVPPTIAFSGFTKPTPWFVFGTLLVGQATSRTGLAKRLGYHFTHMVGSSYTQLLLGFITLVYALNLIIPSHPAQIATLAPLVLGVVAALGLEKHSNVAKGLFVILTYAASLFGKMFLSSSVSTLAYGITLEQTGVEVLWSQWFLAFFPLALLTIVASWLTIRWLFPPETSVSRPDQPALQETEHAPGPMSREEYKMLGWLLLGIALWATDFLHHVSPAAIGIGLGLVLTLPKVGVLDIKTVKSVSFTPILFVGGVLSMATVLMATQALDVVVEPLLHWLTLLLSHALPASLFLYWGGFLYHLFVGSEFTMSSTLLPVLLHTATSQGYNPAAVGMLWTFAGTGKLFVYQSVALIFGYPYGIFTARDLFKVGAVLTVIEGFLIMILVPVYWPLIGLSWTTTPAKERVVYAESSPGVPSIDRVLEASQEKGPDPEAEAWAFVRDTIDPQDVTEWLWACRERSTRSWSRVRVLRGSQGCQDRPGTLPSRASRQWLSLAREPPGLYPHSARRGPGASAIPGPALTRQRV
jgi:sodium-dependent dicarboxylate transporter 2/3/5